MKSQDKHRLERCARRLEDLYAWRNAQVHPIRDWLFTAQGDIARTISLGEDWPVVDMPVSFTASTMIPYEWAGQPVELELWLGGEGFVRLSVGIEGGLDPFHRSFHVTDAARGGEPLEIRAEVVPKGLFGSHIREPAGTGSLEPPPRLRRRGRRREPDGSRAVEPPSCAATIRASPKDGTSSRTEHPGESVRAPGGDQTRTPTGKHAAPSPTCCDSWTGTRTLPSTSPPPSFTPG